MLLTWMQELPIWRHRRARRFFHSMRPAEFGTSSVRNDGGFRACRQWLACLLDDGAFSPLKRRAVLVPAPRAVPRRGSHL